MNISPDQPKPHLMLLLDLMSLGVASKDDIKKFMDIAGYTSHGVPSVGEQCQLYQFSPPTDTVTKTRLALSEIENDLTLKYIYNIMLSQLVYEFTEFERYVGVSRVIALDTGKDVIELDELWRGACKIMSAYIMMFPNLD